MCTSIQLLYTHAYVLVHTFLISLRIFIVLSVKYCTIVTIASSLFLMNVGCLLLLLFLFCFVCFYQFSLLFCIFHHLFHIRLNCPVVVFIFPFTFFVVVILFAYVKLTRG